MKRYLIFLILFFSFKVQTATSPPVYLIINRPTIDGAEASTVQQILRVALSLGLNTPGIQILLKESRTWEQVRQELGLQALEVYMGGELQTDHQMYELDFTLRGPQTGEVLNRVRRSRIPQRQVVFQAQEMLIELFSSPIVKSLLEEFSEEGPESDSAHQNVEGQGSAQGSSSISPSKNDRDEQEKTTPHDEKGSSSEKEEEGDHLREVRDAERGDVTISQFESPPLDLQRNPPKKDERSREFSNRFSYASFYSRETIDSENIISVENTISRAGVKISADTYFEGPYENYLHTSIMLGRSVSSTEYNFPVRAHFYSDYRFNLLEQRLMPFIGLEYERNSYVNLGTIGEGLTTWTNNLFWFRLGLSSRVFPYSSSPIIEAYYGQIFSGSTQFKGATQSVKLSGQSYGISLLQKMYGHFYLVLDYRRQDLEATTSDPIKNTNQSLALGIMYR